MPLNCIAVVLAPAPALFELGVIHEVFGIDRTEDGVPSFEFLVCSETPGVPMDLGNGLTMTAPHGLDAVAGADLVVAAAYDTSQPPSPAVLDVFREAHESGAWVLSVCSGAFLLAEAGLLDGRECTTHWRHTDELASRFPQVRINPDVLFVEDDRIITSAGTAAGIDACLHHVRCELGAAVATRIARRMVVSPQRAGGQRQFIERPIPMTRGSSLAPTLEWIREHLADDLNVGVLAEQASMSARTFARHFAAEVGTTPGKWIQAQRLDQARRLLESTDLSVESVANRVGYGSAALLRHHFQGQVGLAPQAYRQSFSAQVEPRVPA